MTLPTDGWPAYKNREERLEWFESHPLRDVQDLLDYSRPAIPRENGPYKVDTVPGWSSTDVRLRPSFGEHPAEARSKSPLLHSYRRPHGHRHTRLSSSEDAPEQHSILPLEEISIFPPINVDCPGPSHGWVEQVTSIQQPEPIRNEHSNQRVDEMPLNTIGDPDRGVGSMGHNGEAGPVGLDPWMAMSEFSGLTPPVTQAVQDPVEQRYEPPKLAASDLFW